MTSLAILVALAALTGSAAGPRGARTRVAGVPQAAEIAVAFGAV